MPVSNKPVNKSRSFPGAEAIGAAQIPPAGHLSIDHVSHFIPDVDAASAALQALGFTLTPFSAQSHRLQPDGPLIPAGTGNRCIMLERGYIELLTPTGDTPNADQLRAYIARYVGVHVIALGTGAAEADYGRLQTEGFEPLTPVALQRQISTETAEGTARFTIVRVPPGKMAEGRIQYCQHHTPHLLWQPRWIAHPNAVSALTDVLVCVADPRNAAARYSRYTGIPVRTSGGAPRITTIRGELIFIDAPACERAFGVAPPALPWIGGYVLESSDFGATQRFFADAGCAMRPLDERRFAVTLPAALGGIAICQAAGSGPLRFDA